MSHFTKVSKAKIKSKAAFLAAAKELGFLEVKGKLRGYNGDTRDAEVVVRKSGCPYDVGLVKGSEGTYDMEADWWGVNQHCTDAANQFTQLTTKCSIQQTYAKQGFMVQTAEQKDGSIKLTLTK